MSVMGVVKRGLGWGWGWESRSRFTEKNGFSQFAENLQKRRDIFTYTTNEILHNLIPRVSLLPVSWESSSLALGEEEGG